MRRNGKSKGIMMDQWFFLLLTHSQLRSTPYYNHTNYECLLKVRFTTRELVCQAIMPFLGMIGTAAQS